MTEVEGPYETLEGNPASKGQLQFDLWGITPTGLWEWTSLKERIQGLRHSLLCAPMPTASTTQILGNNECFEPYTKYVVFLVSSSDCCWPFHSDIYTRRALASGGQSLMIIWTLEWIHMSWLQVRRPQQILKERALLRSVWVELDAEVPS
jgi:hypothetical protein